MRSATALVVILTVSILSTSIVSAQEPTPAPSPIGAMEALAEKERAERREAAEKRDTSPDPSPRRPGGTFIPSERIDVESVVAFPVDI